MKISFIKSRCWKVNIIFIKTFLTIISQNFYWTNKIIRIQQIQNDSNTDYESIKLYYSDRIHASMTFGLRYTVNECYFKINTFQVYHIKQDAIYKRFHSSKKNLSYSRILGAFLSIWNKSESEASEKWN